jgi:lysophospholipase L1-like esterase
MSSPSAPAGARREQRVERRRNLRIVAVAVAVCALLAGGTAFALTSGDEGDRPVESTDVGTKQASGPVDDCPPLTPDAPLNLWIGGDSLAGSLGPSLGEVTAATGIVQPQFDSRVSSGLTSPEFFDWPEHAAEQLPLLTPDAVAFVIGTNDAKKAPTEGEAAEQWRAEYELLTDEMMTILIGPGRDVYWVGAPIMESENFSEQIRMANEVAQRVAERHPEVTYIDAYTRFSSPEGGYLTAVESMNGEEVTVRADDGVHFTPEGGDYLADPVFALLDAEYCVGSQAVTGAAKDILETEGSTRVPGTSRDVSTPATTATTAATAPPTTAAPTSTTSSTTTTTSTTTSSTTTTTTTTTTNPVQGQDQ